MKERPGAYVSKEAFPGGRRASNISKREEKLCHSRRYPRSPGIKILKYIGINHNITKVNIFSAAFHKLKRHKATPQFFF